MKKQQLFLENISEESAADHPGKPVAGLEAEIVGAYGKATLRYGSRGPPRARGALRDSTDAPHASEHGAKARVRPRELAKSIADFYQH